MVGKLLAAVISGLLMLAVFQTAGCEPEEGPASLLGKREAWDYGPAMKEAAKRFTGVEGVVLHLGDSITYASPYTAWARGGEGKTPEDEAVLAWSHCGENDDLDGYHLASYDVVYNDRSYTAASGVRADQYIEGGHRGLPPLEEIVTKYNPQLAIVMLGSNDVHAKRPAEDYLGDMETVVQRLLANGTVVILSTIPPVYFDDARAQQYNAGLWGLAERHKLPIIDFYGEILARRPGTSWDGTLLNKGDVHPTATREGVTSTSPPTPENLRESGYLLRGWLSVQKLKEVKARVID